MTEKKTTSRKKAAKAIKATKVTKASPKAAAKAAKAAVKSPPRGAAGKPKASLGAAKKAAAAKGAKQKAPQASGQEAPGKQSLTPEERYVRTQELAYHLAERDGFSRNPMHYWLAAEAEISQQST